MYSAVHFFDRLSAMWVIISKFQLRFQLLHTEEGLNRFTRQKIKELVGCLWAFPSCHKVFFKAIKAKNRYERKQRSENSNRDHRFVKIKCSREGQK